VPPRVTQAQLRRQRRLERYQQVVALFRSGQSQAAISRALGIGRKTIRRWLRRGEFPERKPPHRAPPKVSEFVDYLQACWQEGCHNASRATISLARLLRDAGHRDEAHSMLSEIYNWFTEGFDTPDLKDAKALPEELAT